MRMDLAVVMPVYNEQDCIAEVLKSWHETLSGLDISFKIIVLNDGSTDSTKSVLEGLSEPHIEVVNKPNSGHGPTILTGYHKAVALAEWVFQCDSDNEMGPEHFAALWQVRDRYDALLGVRQGRQQNLGRSLISGCSRLTVRLLFGTGIADVNVPYRLIRSDLLKQIIDQIPGDTFAPNVVISGALTKAKLRIYNHPLPHQSRQTGVVSIVKWKLWKAAMRSFWQTVKCRPRIKTAGGSQK